MEDVAAAEIQDGLALGESNGFEVETDKELVDFTKKTHGMEVYHKIVKVEEDQLDQLGVEPLESQTKEEPMQLSSDEESIPASEPDDQRNRAQSLNPEQYRDFKNLTRQDTVVPDEVEEPETPRVNPGSNPFNFESEYEKQFGKGFGKYSDSERSSDDNSEMDAHMESDVEDEIEKIEVEKVELSKSIDEEALLIWTRILKLNSY